MCCVCVCVCVCLFACMFLHACMCANKPVYSKRHLRTVMFHTMYVYKDCLSIEGTVNHPMCPHSEPNILLNKDHLSTETMHPVCL